MKPVLLEYLLVREKGCRYRRRYEKSNRNTSVNAKFIDSMMISMSDLD